MTSFKRNGGNALEGECKWTEGEASSEFRHADPVKFRELVVGLGLDYEEGCWPTVRYGSNDIYKSMVLSPKDYYLISRNNAMKLVCWIP